MQGQRNLGKKLPSVTRTNLENWKVLKKTAGGYLASNAFVLLTSDYFPFSRTQCAVFKGTSRGVFLDKREYTGPLYEQIEEALAFVLRNIRFSAKIEGVHRKESYELPPEAIREMIVNAHCHRNMTAESCVQVAVYDDRLEVTSPGGLYNGLTFEEALQGHSKLRNRVIANVFGQMGLVEAWGTGLQRIQGLAREYGLPEPAFIEMPESFRVNLYRRPLLADSCLTVSEAPEKYGPDRAEAPEKYRKGIGEASAKHRQSIGEASAKHRRNIGETSVDMNATQRNIAGLLAEDPHLTGSALADKIGISKRNIEINIKKLKDMGVLVRHGSPKSGYWEVKR